jgi:pyroglutamyl-peptidase
MLVTGFEPFGPHPFNPSAAVLERLPLRVGRIAIEKLVLPVTTEGIKPVLARAHAEPYRALVHLGLADDRAALTVERRAVNLRDFRIPDNDGVVLKGVPIQPGGPETYEARLPVDAILEAWSKEKIPCAASDSAGHFLCNQVMYTSLHVLPSDVLTGFIHLPLATIVDLDQQARALSIALEVIAR